MNILKGLLTFILAMSLSNCSYELDKTTVPKNLIPKDSFTLILYDVMLLESYYKVNDLDFHSFQLNVQEGIQPIFDKHQIDSARFAESMDYYSKKQEILMEIYNTIQDSLTLQSVPYQLE